MSNNCTISRQLRRIAAGAAFALLCAGSVCAEEKISLNRGWSFRYEGETSWQEVTLPHDFQIHQPWVAPEKSEKSDKDNPVANIFSRLSSRGYKEMGKGEYRYTLNVPKEWEGKRVVIDFEGIMLVGDVYLNGERIGGTDYGYLGFEIDMSKLLKYGQDNELRVIADTGEPFNSRWYTGGGLYRDVNLRITDAGLHFDRHPFHITTVDNKAVKFSASISNFTEKPFEVRYRITDPYGNVVCEKSDSLVTPRRCWSYEYAIDSLALPSPVLWDCENPALYTLTLTLSNGESASETFGVRDVRYTPEQGLLLNGKKVLLKGVANHHELGALGAAAHPAAIEQRIKILKDFGVNHIRCSHNPYSEEFMDICDREGILVVDELYDKWLTLYAGGRKDWTEQWVHDIPEWMTRDRNHPCVVMWSLGNELQTLYDIPFHDWGVTPYRMQKALMDRFDTTRPVTVAMHPRGRNHQTDSIPADLVFETDIASYNYRYMYFPGDGAKYPWMIFYQSEANTSGMGPNFFEMDLDKVVGLAYWGAVDYLGESQGWPAKGWTQGVFETTMQPKPKAYLMRSLFKPEEAFVHIGIVEAEDNSLWNDVKVGNQKLTDSWNFRDGAVLKLYTFTTCDEVELRVGGRSIGRKANDVSDPKSRNRILWEGVEYRPGKIEAIGYRDGKEVCRQVVKTALKASRLKASVDNPDWKKDGDDLQFVRLEALDRRGTVDPLASEMLTFSVSGPAEIVGVDNGDQTSDEMLDGCTRSLYRGRAVVILRSLPEEGEVTLTVKGEKLPALTVKL